MVNGWLLGREFIIAKITMVDMVMRVQGCRYGNDGVRWWL